MASSVLPQTSSWSQGSCFPSKPRQQRLRDAASEMTSSSMPPLPTSSFSSCPSTPLSSGSQCLLPSQRSASSSSPSSLQRLSCCTASRTPSASNFSPLLPLSPSSDPLCPSSLSRSRCRVSSRDVGLSSAEPRTDPRARDQGLSTDLASNSVNPSDANGRLAALGEDLTTVGSRVTRGDVAGAASSTGGEPPAFSGAAAVEEGEAGKDDICMLSGEVMSESEKNARDAQERVITQLRYSTLVFPMLAMARLIDALPGLIREDGNPYEEVVTIVSAVDPFLVGIFAYGTTSALKRMLDREERHEETLEDMRLKAMDSMVNFFERTNLVVFGVAMASFSRLALEVAAESDEWVAIEAKLREYSTQVLALLGLS